MRSAKSLDSLIKLDFSRWSSLAKFALQSSFPTICKTNLFDKYWVQNAQNNLCTLVYGLGENSLQKRQKLMTLLIRFWDREHGSLSSHVWTSFQNWCIFYPHFKYESYINLIIIIYLKHVWELPYMHYFYNMTFWGSRSVVLIMS